MIVYCLGMVSSGSTWLYNISREVMAAAGVDHSAYRVEMLENLLDDRAFGVQNAVLRGHNAETTVLRLLNLTGSKAILTFRDPRDAISSFIQRFSDYGAKFIPICNDVSRNLASLLTASQTLDHLSFFYEDGFTEKPESGRRLADFIGRSITAEQVETIFAKYQADAVKTFIADIDNLDPERLFVDQTSNTMDRETSFHRTHISDMRVGKWKDVLDTAQKEIVNEFFDPYADLLQRRETGAGRQPALNPQVRPIGPVTLTFASKLFAPVDSMDHFTRLLTITELKSGMGIKAMDLIYLPIGRWKFKLEVAGIQDFQMKICQFGTVLHTLTATDGWVEFQHHNIMHDHPFDLFVSYEGMNEDVAVNAPVPQVSLQASLLSYQGTQETEAPVKPPKAKKQNSERPKVKPKA